MHEQIRVISPHEVEINGWCFNFVRMRATRVHPPDSPNSRWCIDLIYLEDKGCITASAAYLKEVQPETTSNHGTWDWNKWFSFFTPPEDHYNKMIDDAYQTYLFERALKS